MRRKILIGFTMMPVAQSNGQGCQFCVPWDGILFMVLLKTHGGATLLSPTNVVNKLNEQQWRCMSRPRYPTLGIAQLKLPGRLPQRDTDRLTLKGFTTLPCQHRQRQTAHFNDIDRSLQHAFNLSSCTLQNAIFKKIVKYQICSID